MEKQVISHVEVANQFTAAIDKKDERYNSLMSTIQEGTELLLDSSVSSQKKYDTIVGCEYLLVKFRMDVEFEHLNVKKILSSQDTPAMLRGLLMKRDQYLAQVSLKLNSLREDIATLQKIVYVQTTRKL